MDDIRITGFGSHLPRRMLTNAELPPFDPPVEEAELERIGVLRRGWAGEGESIATMAAAAALRALDRAGAQPATLDAILLANWTQRRYIPEHAPALQRLLGAGRAFALDLSCACAGFLYGLAFARALLLDPSASRRRILVAASETTSRRARPGSKGMAILGDAAGAFVLERAPAGASAAGGRLLDVELATDGAHHDIMDVSDEGWVRTHLAQRELNELAGRSMRDVCAKVLERQHVTFRDVRWIVPHSGTAGVQAAVARALEAPPEKIFTNFARVGNVSSASIPVALDELFAAGELRPGDLVLSAAVGTGWYAAAALYTV